jgi:hypothetical protein
MGKESAPSADDRIDVVVEVPCGASRDTKLPRRILSMAKKRKKAAKKGKKAAKRGKRRGRRK